MLILCPPQGGVPSAMKFFFFFFFCYEILYPLGIVRLEGGGYISEYESAFPETAWELGYITHMYFHPHLIKPTKAKWTLKFKRKTVLDHVVF